MKFTDTSLRALRPRPGRYDVTATGRAGLQVRVFPTGAKAFYYRYQLAGDVKRAKLGDYPAMSLADAFAAHAEASKHVKAGKHPPNTASAIRAANLTAPTIPDLVDEFLKRGAPSKRKRPDVVRQLLADDVTEHWSDRKAGEISRRDVVLMLDRIVDRGAPTTANKVAAIVAQMFEFAVSRGILAASPAVGLEPPGGKERARSRYLNEDEISTVWHGLDSTRMLPPTRLAVRILLATGQRRGELVRATWADIDLEARHPTWLIPAANAKNGLDHVVPLPPLAAGLFRELQSITGGRPFLVPSYYSNRGEQPIAPEALSQAIVDARDLFPDVPHWTLHDLRRTVRTHLASLGVQTHIAERVIGHKQRGVVGVYDRYEYLPEKRAALALWNEYLAEIIAGDSHKVVPLRKGSGR